MGFRRTVFVLLGMLVFLVTAAPAAYGAGNGISLVVPAYILPGGEFDAQLILKDPSLQALEFSLKFDPAKLSIKKVNGKYIQDGPALSNYNAFCIPAGGTLVDGNTAVNISIGWTGSGLNYSGEKLLGKIRFQAVAEGEAVFGFSELEMIKINGFPAQPIVYGDFDMMVDGTGPIINVEYPINGQITNQNVITCRGTVEPGAELKVNGEQVQVDGEGKWQCQVSLISGTNTISLWGRDPLGNVSQKVISLILDQQIVMEVEQPLDGDKTNQDVITCSGTVDPGAEVKINGQNATVDGLGKWSHQVCLIEGENAINIWCRDLAGNVTERIIFVVLDQTVIPFSLDPLLFGKRTDRAVITVTGRVERGAEVIVNGEKALFSVGSHTRWYARVFLREGENSIICQARDQTGNTILREFQVIRESKRRPYRLILP